MGTLLFHNNDFNSMMPEHEVLNPISLGYKEVIRHNIIPLCLCMVNLYLIVFVSPSVALAACRQPGGCRRIPYIRSEKKNSVRKTSERYKHREEKSGSVAQRPMEIPPLYHIWRTPTAYSCSNTSSWPMSR